MSLRIKSLKFVRPPLPGYHRVYEQCRTCDRVFTRDYVPFSLSNPILVKPCGHGAAERYLDTVRAVDEQQGMRLMIAQRVEALRARAA